MFKVHLRRVFAKELSKMRKNHTFSYGKSMYNWSTFRRIGYGSSRQGVVFRSSYQLEELCTDQNELGNSMGLGNSNRACLSYATNTEI